jgi:hypothetical protein
MKHHHGSNSAIIEGLSLIAELCKALDGLVCSAGPCRADFWSSGLGILACGLHKCLYKCDQRAARTQALSSQNRYASCARECAL